ncbi:MAG: pentapeptide repeat-containing protein [Synechococcales bacterium]|nr:pentapeptide repeat-containing protein [Synechococcales bacterium]
MTANSTSSSDPTSCPDNSIPSLVSSRTWTPRLAPTNTPILGGILIGLALLLTGALLSNVWFTLMGSGLAIGCSMRIFYPSLQDFWNTWLTGRTGAVTLAAIGLALGLLGLLQSLGVTVWLGQRFETANWDAVGALGEVLGALGQIFIAVLAVYIAWRQYVISKDLTIQQNIITQQQTIDTYFQGISDLVLDEEGLLEDWPQERAIAEGRTAAIFSSVDAIGKAKILRFLSRARLLSPLKRDQRLGRPILDGVGGYAEDRLHGIRVIDLGVMLAGAILTNTDLRWVDLSDANLIRSDLSNCELVKANLARTILVGATLKDADINGARFFYGKADTATPRSRTEPPNYKTGEHTGAVVENADFTNVEDLSEEQRSYLCAWGGSKTRGTIPGGCEGIPNKLGR